MNTSERVEQLRRGLLAAAATPCSCGSCPTTTQLLGLAADDDALRQLVELEGVDR